MALLCCKNTAVDVPPEENSKSGVENPAFVEPTVDNECDSVNTNTYVNIQLNEQENKGEDVTRI